LRYRWITPIAERIARRLFPPRLEKRVGHLGGGDRRAAAGEEQAVEVDLFLHPAQVGWVVNRDGTGTRRVIGRTVRAR
jgi:hypothetical protein